MIASITMSLYFGLIVTPPLLRSAHIALLFMTKFFFSGAFVAGAGTAAACSYDCIETTYFILGEKEDSLSMS